MKKMPCFLGIALLFSSLAAAQVDPQPDAIDLFFDEAYAERCLCSDATGMLPVYLVASDISCAGGLAGWEAMVSLTPESTGLMFLSAYLAGVAAIPLYTPPEFAVSLGAPMPQAPRLLLATLTYFVTEPAEAYFRIHPIVHPQSIPGECCYVDGADVDHLVPFVPPLGWSDPAAGLNVSSCCEGAAAETATWGEIKGMFR